MDSTSESLVSHTRLSRASDDGSSTARIIHISMLGIPLTQSPGFRSQLQGEWEAAKVLRRTTDVVWDTLLLVPEENGEHLDGFAVNTELIPRKYCNRLFRRFYLWRRVRELSGRYNVVLVRHSVIDPFEPFILRFSRNVAVVHHTKSAEELRQAGRVVLAGIERLLHSLGKRWAKWPIGVTGELHRYARGSACVTSSDLVLPNGINMPSVKLTREIPQHGSQAIAVFIASEFKDWHGLDRLLAACTAWKPRAGQEIRIIIVGSLSAEQLKAVKDVRSPSVTLDYRGVLNRRGIQAAASEADVGVGSLALDRNGMTEACTLKVREYLSLGLPVYSGHRDSGLPDGFPYLLEESPINLGNLFDFATRLRSTPRCVVRDASEPYISKVEILRRAAAVMINEVS